MLRRLSLSLCLVVLCTPVVHAQLAVVDVANRPSYVRGALSALADRVDHWIYVSSISVYSDNATPGQHGCTLRARGRFNNVQVETTATINVSVQSK